MSERPFINYYEPELDESDVPIMVERYVVGDDDEVVGTYLQPLERSVSRRLNDEEWAEYQQRQEDAAAQARAEAERAHPLLEQIAAMTDDERAQLAELLKGA